MTSVHPDPKNALQASWERHPFTELIRLAWPIAVSMVSFSAMSLIDTLFVGRISAAAIAGVGLASLLAFTVACFGIGMSRAVKTLSAQAIGAGLGSNAWPFLGAGLIWAVATSVLAVAAGYGFLAALPALADAATAAEGEAYLAVRVWSLPLLLAYATTREFSYGQGNSRTPMVASVCANVVNAGLDYLFIVRLELGSAGAAWASLVAQGIELGLLWWALAPPLRRLLPSGRHLREVLRLGWPTGLQFVIEVGSFTATGLIIASISKLELAAHQIGINVLHLSFLPAHAIGEAGAVLAGQAVGAGRLHLVPRVARTTLVVASAYTTGFSVLVLLLAGTMSAWFTDDLRVVASVSVLLIFSVSFQVVDGATIVGGAILRAVGDVRFVAWGSVVIAWLTAPTGAYLLGVELGLGALGAWLGITAEIYLLAALFWWRLAGIRWERAAHRTRAALTA